MISKANTELYKTKNKQEKIHPSEPVVVQFKSPQLYPLISLNDATAVYPESSGLTPTAQWLAQTLAPRNNRDPNITFFLTLFPLEGP